VRNLIKLIEAIKTQIPKDFENKEELFYHLDDRADSVLYTPTEAMGLRFTEVALILQKYLGAPDTEWKKTICDIFSDKIDYKIFLIGDPDNPLIC